MSNWISVNDRLPERNIRVLTINNNRVYEVNYRQNRNTINLIWDINSNYITHWMPLPDPPED